MSQKENCSTCNGSGKCQFCRGIGKVDGRDCQICDGTGKCPRCRGRKTKPLYTFQIGGA